MEVREAAEYSVTRCCIDGMVYLGRVGGGIVKMHPGLVRRGWCVPEECRGGITYTWCV